MLNHASMCDGHSQGMTCNQIQHGDEIQDRSRMSDKMTERVSICKDLYVWPACYSDIL